MDQIDRIVQRFCGLTLRNLGLQAAKCCLSMAANADTPEEGDFAPDVPPERFLPSVIDLVPRATVADYAERFPDSQLLSGHHSRKFFPRRNAGGCHWFAFAILARIPGTPARMETMVPVFEAYFTLRTRPETDTMQEGWGIEVVNPAYAVHYLYLSEEGDALEDFSAAALLQLTEQEFLPRLAHVQRREARKKKQRRQFPSFGVGVAVTADPNGRSYLVTLPPL